MKSSLKNMVLVLFTISAISAFLVGAVQNLTKDAIAAAEEKNKNEAKFAVLSTSESEAVVLRDTTRQIGDFNVTVSTIASRADNHIIGYAVEAPSITRNGYSDRIYLMVGFMEEGDDAIINSIEVLSQKETPGLGANMTNPGNKLETSVLGKNPAKLIFKVKKDDPTGSFDSLTGSTISSRAYANAVETAYAGYLWGKGLIVATEEQPADEAESEVITIEEITVVANEATSHAGDNEIVEQTESATQEGAMSNE